ncbi:hypothetical protein KSP39_PZI006590 [Platanthera zijinensis]|uniref:Uncharacterized protein n=1 Tax=Platanthera zijinensis TaxID=2320716 RepID=A0AAP0GAF4_9ASPA
MTMPDANGHAWRDINYMKALKVNPYEITFVAYTKIEKLRDFVIEKRMKLEKLIRLKNLSSITDLKMPHLEEWALANEEYTPILSSMLNAVNDASNRLPVIGAMRVGMHICVLQG